LLTVTVPPVFPLPVPSALPPRTSIRPLSVTAVAAAPVLVMLTVPPWPPALFVAPQHCYRALIARP
jgi:hypothetical protein